ncbi:uncharacterized protein TNCV_4599221 [Trichonephila clavipes]|nr:uncharacterized protein TNCV_4599221 [Trichonephila clavipes]
MDRISICEALAKRNEIDQFLKRIVTGDETWVTYMDNARSHTLVVTRQNPRELGWEVLLHPPYSSDLAPSDCHLFLALLNFLSDKKLESREDCANLSITRDFANKDQYFYARAIRGLLATDFIILNHGQVTWTTPELASPLLTTTPHQREDVSALDRFNLHRCPKRRVFSGTGLELVTRQATIRYLYHSATAATGYTARGFA